MFITRARGKIIYADDYHLGSRTALQLRCVTINQLVLVSQSQTHEKLAHESLPKPAGEAAERNIQPLLQGGGDSRVP